MRNRWSWEKASLYSVPSLFQFVIAIDQALVSAGQKFTPWLDFIHNFPDIPWIIFISLTFQKVVTLTWLVYIYFRPRSTKMEDHSLNFYIHSTIICMGFLNHICFKDWQADLIRTSVLKWLRRTSLIQSQQIKIRTSPISETQLFAKSDKKNLIVFYEVCMGLSPFQPQVKGRKKLPT